MSAQEIERRIPVTMLTGFLGAGKTTLLNHLLSQPEMATAAVLINEFGSVAVDHHLVTKIDEDVIMLDSGCICCTVRGDLTRSLTELFMRCMRRELKPISRVIIETTGLADPSPVIYTLMQDFFVAERFRIDGVITAVDATHGSGQIAAFTPRRCQQVAMADRLLMTKCDLATPDQVDALSRQLRAINPVGRADLHPARGSFCRLDYPMRSLRPRQVKRPMSPAGWPRKRCAMNGARRMATPIITMSTAMTPTSTALR
jgi:G3E family GTPase